MSNITINIGEDAKPKQRKRARVAVPQDPNRRPIRVVKPPQPQVSPAVMAMPQAQAMQQVQAMPQRIMQAPQRQGVVLRQSNQIVRPQPVPVRSAAQPIARPQAVAPKPVSRGISNKKKVLNAAKYATPWGAEKGGLKVAGKVGKKLGKKLKRFR